MKNRQSGWRNGLARQTSKALTLVRCYYETNLEGMLKPLHQTSYFQSNTTSSCGFEVRILSVVIIFKVHLSTNLRSPTSDAFFQPKRFLFLPSWSFLFGFCEIVRCQVK